MSKIIKTYEEVKPKIKNAVALIANPVIQTLSPRGGNVMFEDANGSINVTNDGVTIAKQIQSDDPVEDKIIEVIKFGALRSNSSVGDGTTTVTLFIKTLVEECMKLLDNGMSRLELKDYLDSIETKLTKKLEGKKIEVTNSEELFNIAKISSNNDEEVAKNVVQVIEAAGQDGLVVIEQNNKPETKVVIEPGFLLNQPLAFPDLVQNRGFSSSFEKVPVLITDKRLYYDQEAETILNTALQAGHKKLVVVASDFIGKTPNFFLANHAEGVIELILIKEKDAEVLGDLATYLGTKVVTEKSGSLVDNLTPDQFGLAEKVFSNSRQSIFTSTQPENEGVVERIQSIRDELEGSDEPAPLEKRLASLTNGTVTIRVGGQTPIELQERIYRYEDAVSATRAAQKDGYVVGGGLTMLSLYDPEEWDMEISSVVKKLCESSVRQIAINSNEHPETVLKGTRAMYKGEEWGYNAKTGEFTYLLGAGVVDPYKVTEMGIRNAVSVTSAILGSGYFIVNDNKDTNEKI